ncbi:uncharacterized protein LOC122659603 [Telopea speciosissima]|uniref:uncharacterized protein LOC122659603 n=1 Tax=Telopea speciosissima TaxID=54955 RepID=UPI001CC75BA2|nr:uncharacterized protein LOC122659603 [Telopea speciosissima]
MGLPFLVGEPGEAITGAISELMNPMGLLIALIGLLVVIQFLSSDRGSFLTGIFNTGGPDSIHRLSGSPVGVGLFLIIVILLLYNRVSIFRFSDDSGAPSSISYRFTSSFLPDFVLLLLSPILSRFPPSFAVLGSAVEDRLPNPSVSVCASFALQALIFDCDGVILESEHLHREAYNDAFAHFNVRCPSFASETLNWDPEFYDELQNQIGGGKPKMRRYFKENGWPSSSIFETPQKTMLIELS